MIDKIINLCSKIPNNPQYHKWWDIEEFILYDSTEHIHIDGINRHSTVLFKVCAKKTDLGLSFKYPCVYDISDVEMGKWKLKRINLDTIKKHSVDLFKFDDVFNLTYDSFKYSELDYFIQNENCNQIEIRNGKYHGVYSTNLLETAVIPGVTDVGLKLITYDCPLRLHYKYGIFDVYSLVAPRVTTEDRFYLRVGEQE